MLRYSADRRTLAYLAITAALTAVNWKTGRLHPVLYPVTLFMFFTKRGDQPQPQSPGMCFRRH